MLSVLQLTMLLQAGSPGGDVPQLPDPEQPPAAPPRTEENHAPSLSVAELLREAEQVVDLFFEACGRLPALSEQDTVVDPNPGKSAFVDMDRVELTLPNPASPDAEQAHGEDEGAGRPAAWRWLPVLLLGGAGAAALALGINQRKRVGAWPPQPLS